MMMKITKMALVSLLIIHLQSFIVLMNKFLSKVMKIAAAKNFLYKLFSMIKIVTKTMTGVLKQIINKIIIVCTVHLSQREFDYI